MIYCLWRRTALDMHSTWQTPNLTKKFKLTSIFTHRLTKALTFGNFIITTRGCRGSQIYFMSHILSFISTLFWHSTFSHPPTLSFSFLLYHIHLSLAFSILVLPLRNICLACLMVEFFLGHQFINKEYLYQGPDGFRI